MCGGEGSRQMLIELMERGIITKQELKAMQAGNGGQLSASWVEWLMGVGIGFSDISVRDPLPHPGWESDPADEGWLPRINLKQHKRAARLKALGNMVVPQQSFLGLWCLLFTETKYLPPGTFMERKEKTEQMQPSLFGETDEAN